MRRRGAGRQRGGARPGARRRACPARRSRGVSPRQAVRRHAESRGAGDPRSARARRSRARARDADHRDDRHRARRGARAAATIRTAWPAPPSRGATSTSSLVEAAVAAGVEFDPGCARFAAALIADADSRVAGVRVGNAARESEHAGPHRHCRRRPAFAGWRSRCGLSRFARRAAALGVRRLLRRRRRLDRARRDARPRRRLHRRRRARRRHVANVCVVRELARRERRRARTVGPRSSRARLPSDRELRGRVSRARARSRAVTSLGPLAVEARAAGCPGCCWPATRPASSIR